MNKDVAKFQELQKKVIELEKRIEYLTQSNFVCQGIVDNLPFGVQIFDDKGVSFKINEKQKELLGLPNLNEGIGKFNVLTDPYSVSTGASELYHKVYNGEIIEHEFEYDLGKVENKWNTRKDKRIFKETIFPVLQKDTIKFVVSILQDKTELRIAERELKKQNDEYYALYEEFKTQNEVLINAKAKIEDSEQFFRLLVENAPEAIFIQTEEKFAYINKKGLDLFGADNPEQILKQSVINRFHPKFQEQVKRRIIALNERKEPQQLVEEDIIKLNGAVVSVEVSAIPINFLNKAGALVFVRDITQRRQLEQTNKKAYNLIKNLAKQVPGVIYQYRLYPDGKSAFPYSSEGMYDIYEVTSEEVKEDASPVFTRIHPDDYDYIVETINTSAKNQTIYSSEFRVILPKQGLRWRHCDAKPELLEDGSTLWHGIITDITERKLISEKLKNAALLLQSSIESPKDMIILSIDKNYNYLYFNECHKAAMVYAYGKDVKIGMNLLDCITNNEDRIKSKINYDKALSGESHITIQEFGDVEKFYYETRYNPIFNDRNEIIGTTAFSANISERKQAELLLKEKSEEIETQNEEYKQINEELQKAKEKAEESDRLKTAFLQNMSHEIRTPLNAISGFSGLLDRPGLSVEKRKNFVSIIQNSSNQLISIISDIITISSIETKQEKQNITKVNINTIIVDLLTIFKQQAQNQNLSIYVKQELSDKQSEIYSDKTKITQILSNLISNALKFTHEGFVEFGYNLKNNELEFYVKDSGIGIKAEFHDKIFERFRQAEKSINILYGGTGLGLAISKAFVELLGGKIWVQSEIEKGAIFYFTIPYTPVNERYTTEKRNKILKTILVAEDEEFNFLFIEELLKDENVKLIHTKDGKETVEICKTNQNIDLILMDIKMPIMTGYDAAIIIKKIKPNLPIVAQSAYALEHEIEKYTGVFDGYLAKPINVNDLKIQLMKFKIY
ncbi:MAG: PAS/PAC sensor hybrid histidine kinase [candidate division TM6 bacterium GW2011_GWF2_33_332]|nr:MAG: PAS/PAC sensor hybrid histidine kinase [candidate division TM6 bacterium GW2011_GWF2_33_332]